jgi:hypothetical protein
MHLHRLQHYRIVKTVRRMQGGASDAARSAGVARYMLVPKEKLVVLRGFSVGGG